MRARGWWACLVVCGSTLSAAADAAFVTLALEVADGGALEAQLRSSVTSLGLSARIATCEAGGVSGELACVRVSRSDATQLWVELSDGPRSQRATRRIALGAQGIDAVSLEELSQIVEASLGALAAGQALPAAVAVAPPAPKPQQQVAAVPPAPKPRQQVAVRAPAPLPAASFAIDSGYELGYWASRVWIGGPRVGVRYRWSARTGISLGLWSGLPVESTGSEAQLALWPSALRTLAFAELDLSRQLHLAGAFGLAFELLRVSGESRQTDLRALDATRANVALRAQLTLRWRFVSRLSLVLEPCLELSPLEVRFGVQRASGFTPILELSALRPSASLGLYLEL